MAQPITSIVDAMKIDHSLFNHPVIAEAVQDKPNDEVNPAVSSITHVDQDGTTQTNVNPVVEAQSVPVSEADQLKAYIKELETQLGQ